jgi:hypothetical protein
MYNCNGCEREDDPNGSTKLHMDLTDAVNIMLWAGKCSDGTNGFALWHIFSAEMSDIVRQFLQEEGLVEAGDLIHSQNIYINRAMRQRLYAKYGIRPAEIYQRPGEAVFIPAGCAHQVRPLLLPRASSSLINFRFRLPTDRTQSRLRVISFPYKIFIGLGGLYLSFDVIAWLSKVTIRYHFMTHCIVHMHPFLC